jgi:hypothetical protein
MKSRLWGNIYCLFLISLFRKPPLAVNHSVNIFPPGPLNVRYDPDLFRHLFLVSSNLIHIAFMLYSHPQQETHHLFPS